MEPAATFNPRSQLKLKIPPGVDRAKFPAALKLIAQNGASISAAFRAVGYKENYARRITGNKNLKPVIHSAQDMFINRYMDHAEDIGLTAEKTGDGLNALIDGGSEMAKLGAIKAHHQVILQTLAISARSKSPNFNLTHNNFVLPSVGADDAWKSQAIEAQREELRAAKEMEAGMPIPEAQPVRKPIVHTEAYKRGRSAAIKRGHETRKRKAARSRSARQAQARKPRVS